MAAKTTHFRVGNGDMTLFEFESGTTLLVDCNIRDAADDPDEETADVGTQIRSRLKRETRMAGCTSMLSSLRIPTRIIAAGSRTASIWVRPAPGTRMTTRF